MVIEKREFPRVNVSCKISTVFGERLLVFNSHTENIGAGGINVIIEEKLAYSTVVDLKLFLLDREKPLKCKGRIVWVNEMKPTEINPRLFDTGIQFIEISNSDQEEIKKLVNTIFSQATEIRGNKDAKING